MAAERVQKILAQAGIASRRRAEDLITEGLVTINGKLAKLGDKAELGKDSIKVRGKLLGNSTEAPLYLAFYKPKGVISMMSDPQGRPVLLDYLLKIKSRLFPVGRLDFNSEGLILLTNDGAMAEKLQRRDDIPRVYHVKIKGAFDAEMKRRIERGAKIDRKLIKPHSVRTHMELEKKTRIEIVMLGAGAQDLKGMIETQGFLVEKMVRTAIGHVTIRGMLPGQYRMLRKSQIEALITQPELGMRKIEEEREAAFDKDQARKKAKARQEAHEGSPVKPLSPATSRRTKPTRSGPLKPRQDTPFEANDRSRGSRDIRRPGPKKPRASPRRER